MRPRSSSVPSWSLPSGVSAYLVEPASPWSHFLWTGEIRDGRPTLNDLVSIFLDAYHGVPNGTTHIARFRHTSIVDRHRIDERILQRCPRHRRPCLRCAQEILKSLHAAIERTRCAVE